MTLQKIWCPKSILQIGDYTVTNTETFKLLGLRNHQAVMSIPEKQK